MNPAGDLLEPLQYVGEGLSGPHHMLVQSALPARYRGLRLFQIQHQRDQLLLGAVVQIAFDSPTHLVTRGDDPHPWTA